MFTKGKFSRSEEASKIYKSCGYSLANRVFKAKNSVVCAKFPFFPMGNFIFIFTDKSLKLKEIGYLTHFIKFKILPVFFMETFFIFNSETQTET